MIQRSTKGERQAGEHWAVQSTLLSFVNPRRIPHWGLIGKGIQSQSGQRVCKRERPTLSLVAVGISGNTPQRF